VYIWAYFFVLILPSVFYVGKTVKKWNITNIMLAIAGAAIAICLTFLNPAVENSNPFFVFICGIVAICSMILPGISGSFVLILMGNYKLIVLQAINNRDIALLLPFMAGCIIGLVAFAHILSWVLKKYKNQTIATLTGFICGSLLTIWPWQKTIYVLNNLGEPLMKKGKPVIFKHLPMMPESLDISTLIAICIIIAGIISIYATETIAAKSNNQGTIEI
jgi:putative membrane protein